MDVEGTLIGIDFNPSHGQKPRGRVLAEDGIAFAWGKTSEGTGWQIPAEDSRRIIEDCWRHDVAGGFYHFLWGNNNHKAQMASFVEAGGGAENMKSVGICLDVETYQGQTAPRRVHVLEGFRYLHDMVGADYYWAYSGDWYWRTYVDRPGEQPVLQQLDEEGVEVRVWSSPDSGYVEGPGTIRGLAEEVPEREFREGFSGMGARIVQVSDNCRTRALSPVDGNITRLTRARLDALFNRKAA